MLCYAVTFLCPSQTLIATTHPTPPPSSPTTESEQPILSPSESTDVGLIIIIGSVTVGIVVIILTLIIVVIAVAVLLKKHETTEEYSVNNAGAVPMTTNEAYGLTRHGDGKSEVEENIYNYPEVNVATIEAKQNEAYGTHTDIITTEGNQAYGGANIATWTNN